MITNTPQLANAGAAMASALLECLEYFENREDVLDGDYGVPRPNEEMQIASEIRDVLEKAGVRL